MTQSEKAGSSLSLDLVIHLSSLQARTRPNFYIFYLYLAQLAIIKKRNKSPIPSFLALKLVSISRSLSKYWGTELALFM